MFMGGSWYKPGPNLRPIKNKWGQGVTDMEEGTFERKVYTI